MEAKDAALGEVVAGRYELEELLGSGGMGAVYGATHRVTGRAVALKRLHPRFAGVDALRARFLREARAVGALRHPGIVEVLDAGLDASGSPFVVFERLEGHDLAVALRERSIDGLGVVRVALEVLAALEVAHAQGFVHRDVKPGNVFLLDEGTAPRPRVKLLDFGIVRALRPEGARLTEAGVVLGTPVYMSPEQLAGQEVDGRADLWSVAVIVYLGLTGRLPFEARGALALAAALLRGCEAPTTLDPALPAEVDRVMARALAPELEARFADAAEMSSSLRVLERVLSEPQRDPRRSGFRWEAAIGDIARETEHLKRARSAAPTAPSEPGETTPPRAAERRPGSWWRRALGRTRRES